VKAIARNKLHMPRLRASIVQPCAAVLQVASTKLLKQGSCSNHLYLLRLQRLAIQEPSNDIFSLPCDPYSLGHSPPVAAQGKLCFTSNLLMEGSSSGAALQRLAVLSKQLVEADPAQAVITRVDTKAEDEESRPAPAGGRGTLTVLDNRSGKKYTVRKGQKRSCCMLMWPVMCAMRAGQQLCPVVCDHDTPCST
jgi:hypothetical protein